MRKRYPIVAATAALISLAAMVPATALPVGANAGAIQAAQIDGESNRTCQKEFEAAVHEDNEAYNAHDIERYKRALHPKLIVMADGEITVGRDAHLNQVRELMNTPGWTWKHTILSTTLHGCKSGIAVMDFTWEYPPTNRVIHYSGTMTMVREHGRWSVAQDNIFTLTS